MPLSAFKYQCPDCRADIKPDPSGVCCPICGRSFAERNGILYLLPKQLDHENIKVREREGWRSRGQESLEKVKEYYLGLPFSEENLPHFTHYREASRQFRLAARFLEPLAGKRGLDLGGSIGFAAWRFAQLGAEMVLADFNDDSVSGLGGADVYLEQGPAFARLCVDAERLPLTDGQFDFVFCCAFLHHLPSPGLVLRHIARVLRPGGVFIATSEAFCPFWMTRQQALSRCDVAVDFVGDGINEQVFYTREYRRWFRDAGLALDVVNPRWDDVEPGRIDRNRRLARPDFTPEILTNRASREGMAGALARLVLKTGVWRPLTHPPLWPPVRRLLLAGTQKFRILIGTKPL